MYKYSRTAAPERTEQTKRAKRLLLGLGRWGVAVRLMPIGRGGSRMFNCMTEVRSDAVDRVERELDCLLAQRLELLANNSQHFAGLVARRQRFVTVDSCELALNLSQARLQRLKLRLKSLLQAARDRTQSCVEALEFRACRVSECTSTSNTGASHVLDSRDTRGGKRVQVGEVVGETLNNRALGLHLAKLLGREHDDLVLDTIGKAKSAVNLGLRCICRLLGGLFAAVEGAEAVISCLNDVYKWRNSLYDRDK